MLTRKRHGLTYAPDQVVISNGAKHSLHNVFTALCNPGDEVIIPAPYWVSYAELVKLTGAKPVIVETREEDDFKLTPAQLTSALTPRTTILLLCSPSNPTGSVYTPEELAALADIVLERNLLVVSDEIYERLLYGSHRFASFPDGSAGTAGADDRGQRREQGLRDDRLADRLDAVAQECRRRDGRSAKPGDIESVEHQPICGRRCRRRAAGMRRANASRVCQAAGIRRPSESEKFRA